MKKNANKTMIITTLVCLLPIILGIALYKKLPEQIAIHFNNSGVPDNYSPKALAVFGLPSFLAAINLYTHFRLNNDPKRANINATIKQALLWAAPLLSLVLMPITLFMAMGSDIPVTTVVMALVGVVLVICGNYLPKCKRNYTVGIKLPWTLDDQDNWNKTHRFAGFVWVIGGLVFTVNAFFSILYITFGVLALLVVLPIVYSYLFYRNQQGRRD